jgi:hypothetical protein
MAAARARQADNPQGDAHPGRPREIAQISAWKPARD